MGPLRHQDPPQQHSPRRPLHISHVQITVKSRCVQANGAMPSAPIQPAGFPVQSMGPPGHQSPAMMQGDPAMMAGPQAASWPSMGVPPPGTGSPAMNPAMQVLLS